MKKVMMIFDLEKRLGEVKIDDGEVFSLAVEGEGEKEVMDNLMLKMFTLAEYEFRIEKIKENVKKVDFKEEVNRCLRKKARKKLER